MARWEPTGDYQAKLGGIIYRHVARPITVNDVNVVTFERDVDSGLLSVALDLRLQTGEPIGTIRQREIELHDHERYVVIEGRQRAAVLERASGRVWCDIRYSPWTTEYELDCAGLLFGQTGYPIVLHPDRSKFGKANDGEMPNISRLTLTTDRGSQATAIALDNASCYVIGIAIEHFAVGIAIKHASDD